MSRGQPFSGYDKDQMNRAASFRTMPRLYLMKEISCLKISEAGFSYTGQGSLVKCEGCDNIILLETLEQNGQMLDPNHSMFHKNSCTFSTGSSEMTTIASQDQVSEAISSTVYQENLTQHLPNGDHRNQFENDAPVMHTSQNNFLYDDCDDVDPETENINSQSFDNRNNCKINPGHFGYFSTGSLRKENLPGPARLPSVVRFLQLFSMLTVRIVVECRDRIKIGTGFVSIDVPIIDNDIAEEGDSNGNRNQQEDEVVYIETSRHVVGSTEDITNVKVEFFYDDQCQGQVKSMGAASVRTNLASGDHKSLLVCRPPEAVFVQNIMQLRRQMFELVSSIPDSVKEFLTKKLFIVHHPHGRDKVMSHGDFVLVKHRLVPHGDGRRLKLQKLSITESTPENTQGVYKMLMYAADTCKGSAGAPIITFKKTTSDDKYLLDIWIHNGHNKTHELGTSALKACSSEDFSPATISTSPSTSNEAEQTADSNDLQLPSADSFPTAQPVVHPSYPAFITKQKRLESFQGWRHQNIHEPDYLASVGFFYAGYSDCVRCFQCGLGLRSWKPGDSLLEEHKKHRPSCPFLQALLAKGENHCQLIGS